MQQIRNIIHEIHRRSLWQVLGIYLVGSWFGYQVIHALTEGLGMPDWVPPFAVVLFIIGLPIVLATAFVQEGSPLRPGATSMPGGAPAHAATAEATTGRATGTMGAVAASDPWLTWGRSMAAGVAAFLLLGLTAGAFMGLRNAGIGPLGSLVAAGKVEEQERILIADFRAAGGDTALANVVTEAFRIDFARSTLVRAVEPNAVRNALQRMERTDAVRLDEELAFEMARRDGINVVLTGEVAEAAAGHVLSARLMAASTGEVLAAVRESARTDDELLPAIDRLSRALRERLGESLRSIRRTEPLAQVTTSSLEALEKYTQSMRATGWEGDPVRGFALLEEAVKLDTAFAAAHHGLAVHHTNRYQPDQAMAALDLALRDESRLTEEQRHNARGIRHMLRREYAEGAAEFERLLAIKPQDFPGLMNVAILYSAMFDYERAEQYALRAIAVDTLRFFGYANLAEFLLKQGRLDDAQDAYAAAAERAPESSWAVVGQAAAPASFGRYEEAEANLRSLIDDPSVSRNIRDRAGGNLNAVLGATGRYAEMERRIEQAAIVAGTAERAHQRIAADRIWRDFLVHDRPDRARQALPAYLRLVEATAAADSAIWLSVADLCGWLGDAPCALDALARSGQAGVLSPWASPNALWVHAAVALAAGEHETAIRHLRTIRDRNCPYCEEPMVGRIFERLSQPDSAIASYERYLATPSRDRIWVDVWVLARTHRRLGELYEERGAAADAARHYARLVEIWSDADPELQPVVRDVRDRLGRLLPDR
jgi:eukaryotic-like serine/threonine-protein kinase